MNPFDDPLKELRDEKLKINEGFICPECMRKFASITGLVQHVDLKHPTDDKSIRNSSNEKSTNRKSVNVFGNFRKKASHSLSVVTKKDSVNGAIASTSKSKNPFEGDETSVQESQALTNFDDDNNPFNVDSDCESELAISSQAEANEAIIVQHVGPFRSHWDLFKGQREQRTERNELFTNKLIIRLNRILTKYPELGDFYKRKAHEQKIVPWIPANLVANCPICTAKFGLLFGDVGGRHHCRLCGCVMCNRCSKFYSFESAHKLIGSPVVKPNLSMDGKKPKMNLSSVGKVLSFISFELNPELDPQHWDQLRICLHCDHFLFIRSEKFHLPSSFPIVQIYDFIVQLRQEIEKSIELYHLMLESLRRGKDDYTLVDAKKLQIDIGMMCQRVNQAREKIARMNLSLDQSPSRIANLESCQSLVQRNTAIQANICRSVVSWCQRFAANLPALPSEDEYKVLKKEHEERIQRRINREKAILRREQQQQSDPRHL